ncbi:MAG: hypothetical protein JW942_00155 [Opitutales bacterium]|nr:hypothetical protein [Opitutales bacterium]
MRQIYAKPLVLAVCTVLVASLALFIPYDAAILTASWGNYWLAAALFVSFGAVAWRMLRAAGGLVAVKQWLFRQWPIIAAALVFSAVVQVHEPHQPKILYDEYAICGTAYMMHYERQASFPARAHYVEGSLRVLNTMVDKRPVAFAFLLCTLHDISGYRVGNVYVLNAAFTFALFLLLGIWARRAGGFGASYLAMLLVAGLPLLAQSATSAGFEVMNLCMIAALVLAADYYWRKPAAEGLDMLIVCGLVLATTRYESILYLVGMAAVVLFKWIRERRLSMSWFSAFSPLLLASALVTMRVFLGNHDFHQVGDAPFISFDYFSDHGAAALYFLFAGPYSDQGSSLLLSVAGSVSLLLIIVGSVSMLSKGKTLRASTAAFLPILAIILINTLVVILGALGLLDNPMTTRLGLPLLLGLVFCVVLAAVDFAKGRALPMWLPAVAAVWFVGVSIPQLARHRMTDMTNVSHERAFFREWAKEHGTTRDLFVDESSVGLILEGFAAVSYVSVDMAPWKLDAVLREGVYDNVYVLERRHYDGKEWVRNEMCPLKADLRLRELARYRSRSNGLATVSILEGVDMEAPKLPENYVDRQYFVLP